MEYYGVVYEGLTERIPLIYGDFNPDYAGAPFLLKVYDLFSGFEKISRYIPKFVFCRGIVSRVKYINISISAFYRVIFIT